jgi:hypothetical protein
VCQRYVTTISSAPHCIQFCTFTHPATPAAKLLFLIGAAVRLMSPLNLSQHAKKVRLFVIFSPKLEFFPDALCPAADPLHPQINLNKNKK